MKTLLTIIVIAIWLTGCTSRPSVTTADAVAICMAAPISGASARQSAADAAKILEHHANDGALSYGDTARLKSIIRRGSK